MNEHPTERDLISFFSARPHGSTRLAHGYQVEVRTDDGRWASADGATWIGCVRHLWDMNREATP